MPAAAKTFYEVLGVKRSATAHEIEQAYARLRAELQRQESEALDPRRAAIAKVAYTTLSDPEARSQYDDQLGLKRKPIRVIDMLGWAATGVVVIGLAWWVYVWQSNRAAAADADDGVDVPRLIHDMSPRISRLEAALVSGEVRDLGFAVETRDDEMTAACPELPPGTALTIRAGKVALHAEIIRSGAGGLCTLAVRNARGGIKLRAEAPQAAETLQGLVGTGDTVSARPVSIARVARTPAGAAFVLKAAEPLTNGTPIFDMRERLVGLVVAPQDLVPNAAIALPPVTSPP